ncbi:MAG: gliding motility-associated ABC transporter ATP-binding subunit GldA [Chitinophagaceae bacterium]|nr:gliding motility-associated ABC transporter ATP-binding subunit GldA [Chitinophagaceae bacterium]
MSIQVTGLVKQYGTQTAVNHISFQASAGDVVGFLGPNGAGKSTTMKIITGYLAADSGSVQVCGIDISKEPLAAKRKIGYLPEANPLYYDMYVKEYLGFIAGVHGIEEPAKAIGRVLELTGLGPEAHKKTGQLSKGYKQRVGLAAALIHDPEVLILDEPTSGLDPNQIVEIRHVIRLQGAHKTVLFSSHILQEVEAICDRVLVINKGNIVANDRLVNLQQDQNGNHILHVQFNEAVELDVLERLQTVFQIDRVNETGFRLHTSNPELVRKHLLNLAVAYNLQIISLQSEKNSLEQIFRSLTTVG